MATKTFGALIRRKREEKEIGLREFAKKLEVSPTYLSKIERDEFPPPTEKRVKAIAEILGCDVDDLLARAGRVASELSHIIRRHPADYAALLRTTRGMPREKIKRLVEKAKEMKTK
jgi:transcriptional regulator with XRE-family HTH domain